jgi:hypothetical protein
MTKPINIKNDNKKTAKKTNFEEKLKLQQNNKKKSSQQQRKT